MVANLIHILVPIHFSVIKLYTMYQASLDEISNDLYQQLMEAEQSNSQLQHVSSTTGLLLILNFQNLKNNILKW